MPNMLEDIIRKMENPVTTSKTASAPSAPDAGLADNNELQVALEKAASAAAAPEVSSGDPLAGLLEKAAQLADAEHEANVAEAHMLGAALADGFLAKMAQAEAAVVKQAQAVPVMDHINPELEKFAAETDHLDNVSLQKIASEAGYQAVMEKAAEDYQAGHDAALQEVANVAYGEFLKGAAETEVLLERAAARS